MRFLIFFMFALLMCTSCKANLSSDISAAEIKQKYGERCTLSAQCGDLYQISCMPEVDGPIYYIDSKSDQIIETCGGACMAPSQDYCNACPPYEWTCVDPYYSERFQRR